MGEEIEDIDQAVAGSAKSKPSTLSTGGIANAKPVAESADDEYEAWEKREDLKEQKLRGGLPIGEGEDPEADGSEDPGFWEEATGRKPGVLYNEGDDLPLDPDEHPLAFEGEIDEEEDAEWKEGLPKANESMKSLNEIHAENEQNTLAANYLARNIAEAQSSLGASQTRIESIRKLGSSGFKPSHPGPRPHPEAGGMDHEDWKIADYEYRNYDSDQEEVDELDELEQIQDKLHGLLYLDEKVKAGDEDAIKLAANRERAHIAEQEKFAEWQAIKKGKELPGAKEVHDGFLEIVEAKALESLTPGEGVGSKGWQYEGMLTKNDHYYDNMPYEYTFVHNPGTGRFGVYDERITVSLNLKYSQSITVDYLTLPKPAEETADQVGAQKTDEPINLTVIIDEAGKLRQDKYLKGSGFFTSVGKFIGHYGKDRIELSILEKKKNAVEVFREPDLEKLREKLAAIRSDMQQLKAA